MKTYCDIDSRYAWQWNRFEMRNEGQFWNYSNLPLYYGEQTEFQTYTKCRDSLAHIHKILKFVSNIYFHDYRAPITGSICNTNSQLFINVFNHYSMMIGLKKTNLFVLIAFLCLIRNRRCCCGTSNCFHCSNTAKLDWFCLPNYSLNRWVSSRFRADHPCVVVIA